MAASECDCCTTLGYRLCDECEETVFDGRRDSFGRDLCFWCASGSASVL
ncbi:hypothetical protein [Microbacterium sp. NPDC096154]